MKRAELEKIRELQRAGQPFVRTSNLETGESAIFLPATDEPHILSALDLTKDIAEALRSDRSGIIHEHIFLQVCNPPLRMVVVGAVHIAQALIPMAEMAGYQVTLIDPRGAFADGTRFPGITISSDWPDEALTKTPPDARTAVVTLTHDPKLDDAALGIALKSDAFYIGSLGSKKTHAARLERLAKAGLDNDRLARIHGPVGLAIGAKTPAEIAIAILAQITQKLRQEAL